MDKLKYALEYAQMGWHVLPIRTTNKVPLIKDWGDLATTNAEQITAWWEQFGNPNIGIICGKKSGIVVIDIDNKKNEDTGKTGYDSFSELENRLGCLPQTVSAETPSGGMHYYFRYPSDREVKQCIGIVEHVDILSDTESNGGRYVACSPSTAQNGNCYMWENSPSEVELAELPKSWLDFISYGGKDISGDSTIINLSPISAPFKLPKVISEGSRDDTLMRYTAHLFGKGYDYETVLYELDKVNKEKVSPPMEPWELEKIVKSINKRHEKNKTEKIKEAVGEEHLDSVTWARLDKSGWIINDSDFAKWFLERYHLSVTASAWTNGEDIVDDEKIIFDIQTIIAPFVEERIAKRVSELYNATFNYAPRVDLEVAEEVVVFKNGAFDVSGGAMVPITKEQANTVIRIDHNYNPNAKCPVFLEFMNELMWEEDIETFRQYLGYCFIPNTFVQSALFICGEGGEGKSRLTNAINLIFGNFCLVDNLHDIEKSRFSLSGCVNKLVFVDDDMNMGAFEETSNFKKLCTLDVPMAVEPKGRAKYEAQLYSRIIAIGNGFPSALYDKSSGFNRRVLPIRVKPLTEGRQNNPRLSRQIACEVEGIIAWAIEGLLTLVRNDYSIYKSERLLELKAKLEVENDHVLEFYESDQWAELWHDTDRVFSTALHSCYNKWCVLNGEKPLTDRSFLSRIKRDLEALDIRFSTGVRINGVRARGFIRGTKE